MRGFFIFYKSCIKLKKKKTISSFPNFTASTNY